MVVVKVVAVVVVVRIGSGDCVSGGGGDRNGSRI